MTREIDNFFTGMFHYCNVRLYDQEDQELMKHWLKTYKFINKARWGLAENLQIYQQGEVRTGLIKTYKFVNKARWGGLAEILQIYQQGEVRGTDL